MIHPKLVKEVQSNIIGPLVYIYQKLLNESIVPTMWKQANVTAVFKTGDRKKKNSYQPISLTSFPGKTLERIIRDALVEHMNENNIFSKSCVTTRIHGGHN